MASNSIKHFISQGSDDVFEQPHVDYNQLPGCHSGDISSTSAIQKTSLDSHGNPNESLLRSDKGKKARDHYRSSGYGTGSGDSAREHSSSSVFVSQESPSTSAEVSHQPVSEVSVEQQTSQVSHVTRNSAKCIENDFKPRSLFSQGNTEIFSGVQVPPVDSQNHSLPCIVNGSQSGSHFPSSQTRSDGSEESPTKIIEHGSLADHNQLNKTSSAHVQKCSQVTLQSSTLLKNIQSKELLHHSLTNVTNMSESSLQSSPAVGRNAVSIQSNQHITDNYNCDQSQPTSSTSGNCFISKSVKTKPTLTRQTGIKSQDTRSESIERAEGNPNVVTPAPGNNDEQPLNQTCSPTIFGDGSNPESSFYLQSETSATTFSSTPYPYDNLLRILEKSARCDVVNCDNADCIKIRKDMEVLEKVGRCSDMILLDTMCYHTFRHCHHPKCPLPWCEGVKMDNMNSCETEDKHMIVKQKIENYAEFCRLHNSPAKEFLKLNETVLTDSMPVEGQHWLKLCMLGNSRKTVLARSIISDVKAYWVIRKIPIIDGHSDKWDLYSKLREVHHESIVTLLWIASFEHHLLVCSQFENLSLRDYLHSVSSHQIGFTMIFSIMKQLISATTHLNNLEIVYLYWISKNILMANHFGEESCVKICNFSCSALKDNYDGSLLNMFLPPHIISPELREADVVVATSDVWGLGCLLYEMVTGKQVWHEYRHHLDVDLKELLGKNPMPSIPSVYPELLPLFQACWEIEWQKRKTMSDIKCLLDEAYGKYVKTKNTSHV